MLAPFILLAAIEAAPPRPAEPPKAQPPEESHPSLLQTQVGGARLRLPGELQLIGSLFSTYPIDRNGVESSSGPTLDHWLRVGFALDNRPSCEGCPWELGAVYQHEFLFGTELGTPDLEGESLPHDEFHAQAWRLGYVRASYERWLTLQMGLQFSHWGMGLLANDAEHGAGFGSGRFSIPFHPDQVLRGSLIVLPFHQLDPAIRGLAIVLGVDRVWEDANARFLDDDSAYQAVGAIKWNIDQGTNVGAYVARRSQIDASGRELRATAVDAAGQLRHEVKGIDLVGGFEVVRIEGDTTRGPTLDYPSHEIRQIAAAASVGVEPSQGGVWLDFVYASGDQDLYDKDQNAFQANRSFDMGFILFREVIRYHSGRSVASASDPNLVGLPSQDIEQIASRGRITNAVVLSPRVSYRPLDWLETYGRPVFAWSAVPWTDPYNTNTTGGGLPRNTLNADPGRYYGTEVDLGVRARHTMEEVQLVGGLELGAVFPGSAFAQPDGTNLDPIYGGRIHMKARF